MSIQFPKLCYEGAQLFLYYGSLTSKYDFTCVIMFCKAVHQCHLFFERLHTHTHTNELLYTHCLGMHSSWRPLVCIALTVSIFSSHHAKLCCCGHSTLYSLHFLVFVKCSLLPLPVLFIIDGSVIPGCTYSHPSARIFVKNSIQVIGLVAGAVLSLCIFRLVFKKILKHGSLEYFTVCHSSR